MSKWVRITCGDDGTPWPDWAFRLMCPACKLKTSTESNFCPYCGKDMRDESKGHRPAAASIGRGENHD